MMYRDLYHHVKAVTLIPPGAGPTDNTPVVSSIIDRAGFEGLTLLIQAGTLADDDATFTVKVEEGDQSDLSDAAEVKESHLIGLVSDVNFAAATDDSKVRKLGYIGFKRYVRVTITPANNTGASAFSGIALLHGARHLEKIAGQS